mmetsp:Transcript_38311/g.83697  ORF Transcript_38311/g.83697 Transcript_38311/m.83697 type:complete len:114 (+) Transcript_38311:47-388(+)
MRRGALLECLRSGTLEPAVQAEVDALVADASQFLTVQPQFTACTTTAGNKLSPASRKFLKQYRVRLSQVLKEFPSKFAVHEFSISLVGAPCFGAPLPASVQFPAATVGCGLVA